MTATAAAAAAVLDWRHQRNAEQHARLQAAQALNGMGHDAVGVVVDHVRRAPQDLALLDKRWRNTVAVVCAALSSSPGGDFAAQAYCGLSERMRTTAAVMTAAVRAAPRCLEHLTLRPFHGAELVHDLARIAVAREPHSVALAKALAQPRAAVGSIPPLTTAALSREAYADVCCLAVAEDSTAIASCCRELLDPETYARLCVAAVADNPTINLRLLPEGALCDNAAALLQGEGSVALGQWRLWPVAVRQQAALARRALAHSYALNFQDCPTERCSVDGILAAVRRAPSLFAHANVDFLRANPHTYYLAIRESPHVLRFVTGQHYEASANVGLAAHLLQSILRLLAPAPAPAEPALGCSPATLVLLGLQSPGRHVCAAELLRFLQGLHRLGLWSLVQGLDLADALQARYHELLHLLLGAVSEVNGCLTPLLFNVFPTPYRESMTCFATPLAQPAQPALFAMDRRHYILHLDNHGSNAREGYRLRCSRARARRAMAEAPRIGVRLAELWRCARGQQPQSDADAMCLALYATPLRATLPLPHADAALRGELALDESWRVGLPALKALLDDHDLARERLGWAWAAAYLKVAARRPQTLASASAGLLGLCARHDILEHIARWVLAPRGAGWR